MSIQITSDILQELASHLGLLVQAADYQPKHDQSIRKEAYVIMQRVSQVMTYSWCVALEDYWLTVLFQDELTWPDNIQDIESYLDYICQGRYKTFGYLVCFKEYDDYLRFLKRLPHGFGQDT